MKLNELIAHYATPELPKPAYATLCALQHLAHYEQLRYVVKCDGVAVGAFATKARAEQFAELGRRDTAKDAKITVVNVDAGKEPSDGV